MNEEKAERIRAAAIKAKHESDAFQMLGMANVYGLTLEESVEQAVQYALARARAYEASAELQKAIES
jgi:hypothetical protein